MADNKLLYINDRSWSRRINLAPHVSKDQQILSIFLALKKAVIYWHFRVFLKVKVKWSPYRIGVIQRVGRGIALLFHDRGTRRGWVVSSTPRPHFTPEKNPVTILQEAGWAPGPVWTGGKSRPHRDSIQGRPTRSQSLCQLSYRPTFCSVLTACCCS